jgi:predicted transcriptional regulator
MKENDLKKSLKGRSCYGHLGGTLGNRLFERLLELGWFEQEENKTTVYKVTPIGEKKLTELGVNIYEKGK